MLALGTVAFAPPEPGDGPPLPSAAEPMQMATPDPLARPTLPAQPSQADYGGQVYYMVCMACHGDKGQGLSPEWVEAWGLGKNSCWESKCHASNHPPEGFELPRYIPAVVSPAVVARFPTALDLYKFLSTAMPWQAPGSLKEEEYWQLTAYLVRANGVDIGSQALDAGTAAVVRLAPAPTATPPAPIEASSQITWLGLAGGLFLVSGLLVFLVKSFSRLVHF